MITVWWTLRIDHSWGLTKVWSTSKIVRESVAETGVKQSVPDGCRGCKHCWWGIMSNSLSQSESSKNTTVFLENQATPFVKDTFLCCLNTEKGIQPCTGAGLRQIAYWSVAPLWFNCRFRWTINMIKARAEMDDLLFLVTAVARCNSLERSF